MLCSKRFKKKYILKKTESEQCHLKITSQCQISLSLQLHYNLKINFILKKSIKSKKSSYLNSRNHASIIRVSFTNKKPWRTQNLTFIHNTAIINVNFYKCFFSYRHVLPLNWDLVLKSLDPFYCHVNALSLGTMLKKLAFPTVWVTFPKV